MPGTLFVVATPIGNLEDLTFRALRVLGEVDVVAAEDTRRTAKLLAHYQLTPTVISLHEHNEGREGPRLVERLLAGKNIALVSDAGTPGISDPGARMVTLAREAGISVVPIPGCSAITTALSISGLSISTFRFAGFPPASGKPRTNWFDDLSKSREAVVFLESPHRIGRTLDAASRAAGGRKILVFRELSKINEELVEYHQGIDVRRLERGELTVIVCPPGEPSSTEELDEAEAVRVFGLLTQSAPMSPGDAIDLLTRLGKSPNSHARNRIKRALFSARQQKKPAT